MPNWLDYFGFDPSAYSIAIRIFLRLLGAIYVIAYVPFLFQIRGLIGEDGILPIKTYLEAVKRSLGKKRYYYVPTLLWLNASDWAIFALIWSGILLGALLLLGVHFPLILLILYIVQLSLISAGQEFLGFGWETLLAEMTIGAFLIVATVPYSIFGWIALNVLLFRFHLQAGASKLKSRDRSWRSLTALSYHYLTQPLPNTQSWFFHKLPSWFHKLSVLFMFYVELVVPFAMFSPQPVRLFVFTQFVALQFGIWFTGNLSYLNYLTVFFCVILLGNAYLEPIFGLTVQTMESSSVYWQVIIGSLGAAFLFLQVMNVWHYFFPKRFSFKILVQLEPVHLCYPHGIFAVMTTKRFEVIVEGSDDGKEWKEYEFYFKPGDLARRPKRVSPYQPRIDWQAWFLPFGPYQRQWWFQNFLVRLLQGSKTVGKLIKHNPFSEHPPKFIRALIYDYEFTSFEEKKKTGNWWKRTLIGIYAPTIRLVSENERLL